MEQIKTNSYLVAMTSSCLLLADSKKLSLYYLSGFSKTIEERGVTYFKALTMDEKMIYQAMRSDDRLKKWFVRVIDIQSCQATPKRYDIPDCSYVWGLRILQHFVVVCAQKENLILIHLYSVQTHSLVKTFSISSPSKFKNQDEESWTSRRFDCTENHFSLWMDQRLSIYDLQTGKQIKMYLVPPNIGCTLSLDSRVVLVQRVDAEVGMITHFPFSEENACGFDL